MSGLERRGHEASSQLPDTRGSSAVVDVLPTTTSSNRRDERRLSAATALVTRPGTHVEAALAPAHLLTQTPLGEHKLSG